MAARLLRVARTPEGRWAIAVAALEHPVLNEVTGKAMHKRVEEILANYRWQPQVAQDAQDIARMGSVAEEVLRLARGPDRSETIREDIDRVVGGQEAGGRGLSLVAAGAPGALAKLPGMGGIFKKKQSPEEAAWHANYEARQMLYESHFGPFPTDVQKLRNLIDVWPGGCLVQFPAPKLGPLWVHSTFGLSNSDMPNCVTLASYRRDGSQSEAVLARREPRQVPAGLAGFGYEIMLLTEGPAQWPLMFLNWLVQRELLKDLDVLSPVQKHGAFCIEEVNLGGNVGQFSINPARPPLPAKLSLPAGACQLLVATHITMEELNYALENMLEGRGSALMDKRGSQISRL